MITITLESPKINTADTAAIKEAITKTLEKEGIKEGIVDVAIVSESVIDDLNKKYYKDEVYMHPIFTFPESVTDDKFIFPPDGKKYLGQMVINYDMAINTAAEKSKPIEDVIRELAIHGSLHLVGIHH
jgi:probable rRNA maturation factor